MMTATSAVIFTRRSAAMDLALPVPIGHSQWDICPREAIRWGKRNCAKQGIPVRMAKKACKFHLALEAVRPVNWPEGFYAQTHEKAFGVPRGRKPTPQAGE